MEVTHEESWSVNGGEYPKFGLAAKMISNSDSPIGTNPAVILYKSTGGIENNKFVTNLSDLVALVKELKSIQDNYNIRATNA